MPDTNPSDPSEVDSAEKQLQQVTMADDADSTPAPTSNTSQENRDLVEKWAHAIHAIKVATRKAFPGSPKDPTESSLEEFRQYWHGVFTHLLDEVAQDSSIPHHLISPPVKKFIIKLFDQPHPGCCPCMMPNVGPSITLENDEGVNKIDLLRALRDYLYGEGAAPAIYLAWGDYQEEYEMAARDGARVLRQLDGSREERGRGSPPRDATVRVRL